MKIEIVVDPSRPATSATLASRVAPAAATEGVPRTGGRRPRGGRGGPRKRVERPAKSAADLDAEMEDYTASATTAGAPAATA
ncbi:hypothetical protein EIP86_008527 [Pleurotus ostreatoroseus]|nr:hypothetical protein EIP86_008527 [Pleurotus ostreatoroseus]